MICSNLTLTSILVLINFSSRKHQWSPFYGNSSRIIDTLHGWFIQIVLIRHYDLMRCLWSNKSVNDNWMTLNTFILNSIMMMILHSSYIYKYCPIYFLIQIWLLRAHFFILLLDTLTNRQIYSHMTLRMCLKNVLVFKV